MAEIPSYIDFADDIPEIGGVKSTLVGVCELHSLLAHSSEFNLILSILAVHREKCSAKNWVETHRQFLDRLERNVLMERIKEAKAGPFTKGSESD